MKNEVAPEPPIEEVKKFSKKNSSEKRVKTARRIREERAKHFEKVQGTEEEIAALEKAAEERRIKVEEIITEMQRVKSEIAERNKSFFSRLLSVRERRSLEAELGTIEKTKAEVESDYQLYFDLLNNIKQQPIDVSELENAKKILDEFYNGQSEEWEAFREGERKEKEARDVVNIISRNNCLFVHVVGALANKNKTGTLLRDNVEIEMQMKLLLALQPTISTSTLRRGEGKQLLFGGCDRGMILNAGSVEVFSDRDIRTIPRSIGERVGLEYKVEGVGKDIDAVVNRETYASGSYNEFSVKNPRAVCRFFSLDGRYVSDGRGDGRVGMVEETDFSEFLNNPKNVQEFQVFSRDTGVPVVFLKNGTLFRINFNPENTAMTVGEEITQEELQAMKGVSQEKKEELLEEIFEDSPLNLETDEFHLTDAYAVGSKTYLKLRLGRGNDLPVLEKIAYKPINTYEYWTNSPENIHTRKRPPIIEEGEEIEVVGRVVAVGAINEYFRHKGKNYCRTIKKWHGSESKSVEIIELKDEGAVVSGADSFNSHLHGRRVNYVKIGDARSEMLAVGKSADIAEDYLEATVRQIEYFQKQLEDDRKRLLLRPKDEYWPRAIKNDEFRIQKIASNMIGFAEEARKSDDEETYQKIFTEALKHISPDKVHTVVTKRLGPNGEYIINKEDLS